MLIQQSCFLLEEVEHRDETTWGYYLLEAESQGLNPDYTIADAGSGIRAGQKAAWGEKPCHGDVWHIFDQGEALCRNLAKKAQGAITKRKKLEHSMELAKLKGKGNKLSAKLTQAHKNEAILQKLASDIRILLFWLRNDILSLAGAEWSERMELMNFMIEREGRRGNPAMTNRVVEELRLREEEAHKGIKGLRVA
ncbi:hypothetical protein [Pleurocapsa sp. CCALA 161]|uniref:hypothetical protein n=1 Tax=Pleurocapsa sp. CCALA 161 TaxID=2107688 RepID=UPI0018EA99C3|nr:hypothetical protein [Pleurocapsa sp. CCALA 161]